jgi:sulfoquinovosyltransferase
MLSSCRVFALSLFMLLTTAEAFTAHSHVTGSTVGRCGSNVPGRPLQMNAGSASSPPLRQKPPRNILLMVEPTPFTHVSGYANRFKEMLKFLKKAGDNVDILTVDAKTPAKDLPKEFVGYPIEHTLGFTFPLYNQISLTCDLPEAKGAQIIEARKPDLIHVTSP